MADAQLDLFHDPNPNHEPMGDCVVYDAPNRSQGHLRIDVNDSSYVFLNVYADAIAFGHMTGPTGRLNPSQLREIGDYCHRAARRIEERKENR
ncbi:hypothetical protein ACPXB3_22250 [Gordonia sp. DT219]|uniref:hypothetical protein n=1 Tax=Gordonia sp. DT219 TaxID=3416658 RepID=UPI003CE69B9F